MRVIATVLAALTLCSTAAAHPYELTRNTPDELRMIKRIDRAWPQRDEWIRIAICETGSRPPNWSHHAGQYEGGLGFFSGSWDAFRPDAFPKAAYLATSLQQMIVGERIYDRYGLSGWGCRGYA